MHQSFVTTPPPHSQLIVGTKVDFSSSEYLLEDPHCRNKQMVKPLLFFFLSACMFLTPHSPSTAKVRSYCRSWPSPLPCGWRGRGYKWLVISGGNWCPTLLYFILHCCNPCYCGKKKPTFTQHCKGNPTAVPGPPHSPLGGRAVVTID